MWSEFAVLLAGFLLMVTWLAGEHQLGARDRTFGSLSACFLLSTNVGPAARAPGHAGVLVAVAAMLTIALPAAAYRLWSMARWRNADQIHPLAATDANKRGSELLTRYDRTGDTAALAAGIQEFRVAAAATVGRPAYETYLGNLILALTGRYQRLGDVTDLEDAIAAGEQLRIAAASGAPFPLEIVPLLAALRLRYAHRGDQTDLDEAITLGLRLVGDRPGRGRLWATAAEEVSRALTVQYGRTDRSADLRRAIELREQALTAVRWDRRRRGIHYANRCHLRNLAADDSRQLLDIEHAIADGRRAVSLLHRRDRLHPHARHNLALALRRRYRRRRDPADLDEVIEHARQATTLIDADDPELARCRSLLAMALFDRYQLTQQPGELRVALDVARVAAAEPRLPITLRVPLGLAWAEPAAEAGMTGEAVQAFKQVVDLMPLLVPRELARADQEHQLGQWAGLPARVASLVLADEKRPEADRALTAVQLLEKGRGLLLSRELVLRNALAALHKRDPDLAGRLVELRGALAVPPEPAMPDSIGQRERTRARRRSRAAEMDKVLEHIRDRHPDLTGLGTAPSRQQLAEQSEAGPIIVVNVSRYGSHAVLITPDDLKPVPLSGLTPKAFTEHLSLFSEATKRSAITDVDRQKPLFDVLAWLWDTVAGPVLDKLNPRNRQRVWWMPTGSLALLPIHAAGHHGTGDTVLDRVVSSYTPTLSALAYARTRPPALGTPGPLVVAIPNTPKAPPLPAAAREANLIYELFPDSLILRDKEATTHPVRAGIGDRSWAHIACHTELAYQAPSDTRLLLHDHEDRSFTIQDIAALNLPRAELAYLSSCSTASPPGRLVDEAVHLAGAFLLAGFPQVIGSLWPVNDTVAFRFCKKVYNTLRTTAPGQTPAAALASHEATLDTRKRYPELPALWCGQLHVGR
jgi:hypothetical protein